jgi:signal transduction histidine kinase
VLHDELQQLLCSARINLEVLRNRGIRPESADLAGKLDETLAHAIKVSRTLTADLRPPLLDEKGLSGAISWLAQWMGDRVGLHVAVEASEDASPHSEALCMFVFDAVRELLFNVVQHAGVDRAVVRFSRADAQRLRIAVEDQGRGFVPQQVLDQHKGDEGFGLAPIRRRMESLGGEVEIHSAPDQGCTVALLIPLIAGED